MAVKDIAIFGVYPSDMYAELGAADLISAGFPTPDISVLFADLRSKRELASIDTGAAAVGLLSGALGILSSESAQVIAGLGRIVAAGPITARLRSLGSRAANGLSGALVDWGIAEHDAKSYEDLIQDGGTLLSVRCGSPARAKRATQVLNSSGADHVAGATQGF